MDELTFHIPTKVIFGLDVLNRAGQVVSELGKRALVVSEAVLFEERAGDAVLGYLQKQGVEVLVFDEVGSGTTSSVVERAIELARASRADLVIGFGGIRALSCAKCVARMAPLSLRLDELFTTPLSNAGLSDALPYVEIPTTCRNPFMLTDECLLVDARNRRASILDLGIYAYAAIIDPTLTLTLSEKYTVSTMMDTLLAAIESYFSRKSTFLSDTLALRAIGVITSIMDDLAGHGEDRDLRFRASQAGLLVALSLTMSTQGVGAACAYALSAKAIVPKSMVSTVMIPYVLEHGMLSQPKKVERIGNVLGEEIYGKPLRDFSVHLVDVVRQRMGLLQIPMRLADFDVSLDSLVEIAAVAHAMPMTKFLVEPMAQEDILALLREAL
ncbi:MAG TPA: iron-containing alcohol dehydrogenase [Spirochaetia bacterium]|nr:iron-containing alcohol dehydrogenase [Spirochaetia bacterium]